MSGGTFSKCPACGKLNIHGATCVCGQRTDMPVTASDARPPSDTGATGWHTHSGRAAYRDDQCARHDDDANPARPVIVADPAEARETVLRAVHNAVTRRGAGEDWDTDDYHAVTNDVLAALAGQEQP